MDSESPTDANGNPIRGGLSRDGERAAVELRDLWQTLRKRETGSRLTMGAVAVIDKLTERIR